MKKKVKAIASPVAPEPVRPLTSVWKVLYQSLYPSKIYIEVARLWKGFSYRYLLLLISLVVLPLTVNLMDVSYRLIFGQYINPIKTFPPLHFDDGYLTVNKPMPYFVKNNHQAVVAIIDTSGEITDIDHHKYPELMWLLTRKEVMYSFVVPQSFHASMGKGIESETYRQEISTDLSGTYVVSDVLKSIHFELLTWLALALIYPCMIVFFSVWIYSLLIIFTYAGQFFAKFVLKYPISFHTSYRLLMLSATAPLIIAFGLMPMGLYHQSYDIGLVGLVSLYFNIAVLRLKLMKKSLMV